MSIIPWQAEEKIYAKKHHPHDPGFNYSHILYIHHRDAPNTPTQNFVTAALIPATPSVN
jgi:hypothetical protein